MVALERTKSARVLTGSRYRHLDRDSTAMH
jgi:hypothetical protein